MTGLFNPPKRKLRKLLNSGEYSRALEFAASIESKYSRDPDYLFIVGSAHYILGNAKESKRYFDTALAIHDSDIDTLLLSARLDVHLKENARAREKCNKIIAIDPDHREAKELLASISG